MRAFLDPRQTKHNPQSFLVLGQQRVSPEQPERITRLKAGAEAAGCVFEAPEDAGIAQIAAIHTSEYLSFLQTIHGRWQALDGASDEVIPNIHARARTDSYPTSPVGQAGYHQADTACPIGAHTWDAAYWSAQSAIGGARALGEEECAYVLSRPPGHHCLPDWPNGFCLLANIAIAIEAAQAKGKLGKVAVLDWDVHHGNGTEAIYYDRDDVLTISIHQDRCYPQDTGALVDQGSGDGVGFNMNIPLPPGCGHAAYLEAMDRLVMPKLEAFDADLIIVACGFDACGFDPLARMMCSADTFRQMTERLMQVSNGKLVAAHEGGYSEFYVPFCGHAMLEAMSGSAIHATDPLLDRINGQQPSARVQAFHSELIAEMAQELL